MSEASATERQLHHALLDGSTVARDRISEACLGPLVARVRARHPEVQDQALLWDAAVTALMDYLEAPAAYRPDAASLVDYLAMAAHYDLLNLLAKERRRTGRNVSLDAVEDHDPGRKRVQEPATEDEIDLDRLDPARHALAVRAWAEFTAPLDRRLLRLYLDGVRETAPYAAVLGIEGRDVTEQRRAVKRHKDRIKKKLERLGGKLREQ